MYHHIRNLMYSVHGGTPDPKFGNMLLKQFGKANGNLAAAVQYSIQGLNCGDPNRKDMRMDVGTEELSHLEIVGTLARMHLKPPKNNARGPWNEGEDWELVEASAFKEVKSEERGTRQVGEGIVANARRCVATSSKADSRSTKGYQRYRRDHMFERIEIQ